MKSLILSQTDLVSLPLIALVIFMGIFLGVLLWIARPGAADTYARYGQMALEDEEESA
ncbi:cbb3-type cytochrome c oxidase subunit 3 [Myxococcota bacterium]|nr:cbb3-type cytochrome c oxidase subunit 3 [Myxococcota bacterium]MBU1431717.1 cbb3-type cytochrome c oxidase subunit 3 [Myxococcota bacterium]MBU1898936.1 cbb3-type cytochrome c oxidase subunit 3 [Myxococcota bacterium]